jgi:hypothetical protein
MSVWDFGDTKVDTVVGTVPTYKRGDTSSLALLFSRDTGLTASADDRYERAREYCEVAGHYASGLLETNNPWYDVTTRPDAHAGVSPIVRLEPVDPIPRVPGLWVALDTYSDETTTRAAYEIGIDFTVLATVDEYATRSELDAQFSNSLTG